MDLPLCRVNQSDRYGVAPFRSEDFGRFGVRCKSAEEFFTQASNRTNYPLYNTEAHKSLYSKLISQSNALINDCFVNRQGESCLCLIGTKGIGKTTSLKTFVTLSKFVVPDLFAIYISFNNFLIDDALLSKTLLTVVMEVLEGLGVNVRTIRDDESHTGLHLVNVLLEQKAKLLLLIDELDQLYKVRERIALENLHELSYLGNQGTGTVSVVVCGSTSMMPSLITAHASQPVKDEFPLLTMGAPNLNGTKFLPVRIPSNIPIDLVATGILAERHTTPKTINWMRLVAFVAGASARSVGRALSACIPGEVNLNNVFLDSYEDTTLSNELLSRLRTNIIKKLYSKNAVLFNTIKHSSDIEAAIATTPWEKDGNMEFEPLTYKEVQKIWTALIKRKIVSEDDAVRLDTSLLLLADRRCIVVGSMIGFHPTSIYPFSLLQVFEESIRDEVMPSVREKIVDYLKQGPDELAKLTNPRTMMAVATVSAACGVCVMM